MIWWIDEDTQSADWWYILWAGIESRNSLRGGHSESPNTLGDRTWTSLWPHSSQTLLMAKHGCNTGCLYLLQIGYWWLFWVNSKSESTYLICFVRHSIDLKLQFEIITWFCKFTELGPIPTDCRILYHQNSGTLMFDLIMLLLWHWPCTTCAVIWQFHRFFLSSQLHW